MLTNLRTTALTQIIGRELDRSVSVDSARSLVWIHTSDRTNNPCKEFMSVHRPFSCHMGVLWHVSTHDNVNSLLGSQDMGLHFPRLLSHSLKRKHCIGNTFLKENRSKLSNLEPQYVFTIVFSIDSKTYIVLLY